MDSYKNDILQIISDLLSIEIDDPYLLYGQICSTITKSVPDVILTSILSFNKHTNEIIYQNISCCPEINHLKENIIKTIEDKITLKLNNSTSGRLIQSDEKILIVDDVVKDTDYQSIKLAKLLNLKKGIFIKINDKPNQENDNIIILYPSEKSPINEFTKEDFTIIGCVIESIISNSKRIREQSILNSILVAAGSLSTDLSSFLYRVVVLIKKELRVKGCSIFVVDQSDNLVKLKATLGIKPGPLAHKNNKTRKSDIYYKIGEGITGNSVKNNKVYIFHDNVQTQMSKWVEKEMSDNFLCVPIEKLDEKIAIGVIRCSTKSNQILSNKIESFNQEDIELLKYIAKLISIFIELSFYQDALKQIMTKMPHELRNSLQSIVSAAEYLQLITRTESVSPRFAKKHLRKVNDIIEECELSTFTIDGASLLENNNAYFNFEKTNLVLDIVAKIRKLLQQRAIYDRNIVIKYKIPNDLVLFVDRHRMQIVFYNLLVNAIKYSTSYHYFNKKKGINITFGENINYYEISISNYGICIPYEKKDDIFYFGVRCSEAISVDPSGKGIGLSLVRKILLMHGITISVSSTHNPTVFTMKIPKSLAYFKPTPIYSEV